MTSKIEIVAQALAALKAQDFDKALTFMTDDITLETPMGPRKGKAEAKQMFAMMANMPGGGQMSDAAEENGEIFTTSDTPMGKIRIVYVFTGDLISAFQMR